MAKNKDFIVPKEQQADFNLLIQRANRRIKANLKYIQKEDIRSDTAQRALVGDYVDQGAWHTSKTVFSRSKRFSSEKEYKQFVRHVMKWGDPEQPRTAESVKEGYYKAIINALTVTALDNGGGGILTKKGHLPANIAKKVRDLSLEQMTHFFGEADPADDLEYLPYSGEDYIGVDRQMFVDITMAKLNALKTIYPDRNPKPKKKVKKRKKRKSRRKKK